MSIPSTGVVTFSHLQTVFGGTNPISMSEYFTNASSSYTSGVSGIPSTGAVINISNFRGKSKTTPVTANATSIPSQTILNTATHDIYLATYYNIPSGNSIASVNIRLNGTTVSSSHATWFSSGNYVRVSGNGTRGQYTLVITPTDSFGATVTAKSITITELIPISANATSIPGKSIRGMNSISIFLPSYFNISAGNAINSATIRMNGSIVSESHAYYSGNYVSISGNNGSRGSYTLNITVTDNYGYTASITVSVTEINIDTTVNLTISKPPWSTYGSANIDNTYNTIQFPYVTSASGISSHFVWQTVPNLEYTGNFTLLFDVYTSGWEGGIIRADASMITTYTSTPTLVTKIDETVGVGTWMSGYTYKFQKSNIPSNVNRYDVTLYGGGTQGGGPVIRNVRVQNYLS